MRIATIEASRSGDSTETGQNPLRSEAPPDGKQPICLLAIDDDLAFLELLTQGLAQEGLEILTTPDPIQGMLLVEEKHPQIVLLDLMLPGMGGMELLDLILKTDSSTDVIMITGNYSPESAVEAIQKGASDYLNKPISLTELRQRVGILIAQDHKQQRGSQIERELLEAIQFEGMVSQSPLMQEVFVRIRRIAPHFRTVLLTGATGTGKELVARAIHNLSPGARNPLAVCNCSALVETLAESELFGHVKGAFTGASQDKIGVIEYARGGTVFLDEIGEMPLSLQAKLLRVLQNQEIQRVGSPVVSKVDVRVVAATHRNLRQMVAEKHFREDLYYRLGAVEIQLPRLAERKEDLPLLERHFLEQFAREYGKPVARITRRAQLLLAHYAWPGNIRELENMIGHACMMAEGNSVDVRDLPERLQYPAGQSVTDDEELVTLDQMTRRYAQRVLMKVNNNKAEAASILGISRSTLYRFLGEC